MGRQEQQSESIMGHTRSEDGLWHPILQRDVCAVSNPGVMTNEEGIFINIKLVSLSRLLAHKWSAQ